MDAQGLLMCARYAFAPNSFSYCGPDKTHLLADYIDSKKTDRGLVAIIKDFSVLFPYLHTIAYENNIADPFSQSVVEAYWLGNTLLDQISPQTFYHHLTDTLAIQKRLSQSATQNVLEKLHHGMVPHHSFHVFTIFRRMGHVAIDHTLETMDSCRIGWGRIKKFKVQSSKFKDERKDIIVVETRPVVYTNDVLQLGEEIEKEIAIFWKQRQLLTSVQIGDWVSYHWGMVCDVLTQNQVRNLTHYTTHALACAQLP